MGVRVLDSKILHFFSLTDSFIMHVNKNSFRGPLIIGTFEKRGLEAASISVSLMTERKLWSETFFSRVLIMDF